QRWHRIQPGCSIDAKAGVAAPKHKSEGRDPHKCSQTAPIRAVPRPHGRQRTPCFVERCHPSSPRRVRSAHKCGTPKAPHRKITLVELTCCRCLVMLVVGTISSAPNQPEHECSTSGQRSEHQHVPRVERARPDSSCDRYPEKESDDHGDPPFARPKSAKEQKCRNSEQKRERSRKWVGDDECTRSR